ncbi:nicotinate-nucleotide adenylyltransferase [Mycoplasmoides alvi]|uniref:nicotinate-nucleotide adenylyltransferase n=1 Tax=Mycoplasmoides alvi TaxID=78580 RepID=UPI000B0557EA|nr:nicotinate-nucleotide adenylyltransferase [Mycoplasmoides alvi]
MKKVIIYGGSFDPFHKGHLTVAKIAMNKTKSDLLYFVPSYTNELKQNSLISHFNHRCRMIKNDINKYKKFKLSIWNIKNKNLYSINLINYFLKKFPNSKLYLLIGSDQLNNFHTWKKAKEISKLTNIICVSRPKNKINKTNLKKFKIQIIGNSNIDISSSTLRKTSIKKYMSQKNINYINDNWLYTDDRIKRFLSKERWEHCKRTAILAKKLAIKNNYIKPNDAYIAGLFHDLAKEFTDNELIYYANLLNIKKYTSIKTLHPYVGYYFMKYYYLFKNKKILQAVYRHTEPIKNKISKLDKIVFVADKCEPARIFQQKKLPFNVKQIEKIANKNINLAFKILSNIIKNYFEKSKSN